MHVKTNSQIVYFPQTAILKKNNFWEYADYKNMTVPTIITNKQIIKQTTEALKDLPTVSLQQINAIKQKWESIEQKFYIQLKTILDLKNTPITEINIYPTQLGSYGSYSILDDNGVINIFYRIDTEISTIAEHILTSIIHKIKFSKQTNELEFAKSGQWSAKEQMVDFLMQNTKLANLFLKYKPTIVSNSIETNSTLARESDKYLKELGFGKSNSLEIQNENIINTMKDKPLQGLNKQETTLLKLLIENYETTIDYDMISEAFWGDEILEKFSLQAMTKVIFKIRKKLEINGIKKDIIKTKRGVGYTLIG